MLPNIKKTKDHIRPNVQDFPIRRIYFVILLIVFGYGAVIFRLYTLQVKAHSFYQEMAGNQHKLREKIFPKRGEILLKEKGGFFSAAVNRAQAMVFAVPREVEDPLDAAKKLAGLLGMEEQELIEKLDNKKDFYEVIKRKLTPEEEFKMKDIAVKGVYLTDESWRYYPGGSLAAQVIGFVGYNGDKIEGRYGVESYFESRLQGSQGILEQEKDTGGRWISIGSKSITPAKDGDDIILAIDHILQFKAEIALKNAVERHQADGAKVVIIEPQSGKILAMAAEPSFNLNDYSKAEDINTFRNPVVSDTFECGSVFKPITMAAGLDSGVVSPDSTYTDTGSVREAGYTIKNSDFKAHGKQTMTNVIEKSLNTGVIHVEKLVGNERFLQYIKDFGFGQKLGVDLPHEVTGNLSNLSSKRDIEFFTASFGQGLSVTPLQLAMAYTTIANGGELLKPQIVDSFMGATGEEKAEREVIRKVITKNTANQLGLMLESNVLNGHGKLAGVPGYRVAGKTGTAQIPDKEKGGYKENATVGSFAGFGPVDNPQFAMVVIIDYPKDVEWAESTAAPVFGELAKFMFDYFGTEPTEDFSPEDLEKFAKTHNYIEKKEESEEQTEEPKVESATIKEEKPDKKKSDKKHRD